MSPHKRGPHKKIGLEARSTIFHVNLHLLTNQVNSFEIFYQNLNNYFKYFLTFRPTIMGPAINKYIAMNGMSIKVPKCKW